MTIQNHISESDQRGVTLMIAILVMAGIVLITVSVSFFAISEIRASRAVFLSEPAMAAATSGGEKGIWTIKRVGVGSITNCANGSNSSTLNNNSKVDICTFYQSATIHLLPNTPYTFYLYNPNDINGDPGLLNWPIYYFDMIYKTGSFAVNATIDRIVPVNPAFNKTGAVSTPAGSVTRIDGLDANTTDPNTGNLERRMKVVLQSTGDVTVEVNTNQGMPDFPTVDSSGCVGSNISNCNSILETFKRRINVMVPQ